MKINKNAIFLRILIILVILFSGRVHSQETTTTRYNQWIETSIVDEFGDNTGKTSKIYLTKGKFSNSATTNSDLTIRVIDYKDYFHISLFEYNRPPEAKLDGGQYNFVLVSIKDKRGNIVRKGARLVKSGGLRIKKRNKLGKIISKNEPIQVYITEMSEYKHNSTYGFSLFQ